MAHLTGVGAAEAQPQLPPHPASGLGERHLTLAQMQLRVFRVLLVWPSIALGVIVGWLVVLLVAAAGTGNGLFGLGGGIVVLTLVPNLLAIVCFLIGAVLSAAQTRLVRALARAALAAGPGAGPVASAVLVRVARSSRDADAHQLLYAVHAPGQEVEPMIVPVPHGFQLPEVGSGAWLVLNPEMPAFASFYDTSFEQHQAAGADPALQQLTRVQRGLAVPGRHYWLPVLVSVATALISWGLLRLVVALLT